MPAASWIQTDWRCFSPKRCLFLERARLASCGQQLLMFDAEDAKFRSMKLRPKQADCAVCGEKPSVTQLADYEAFCGAAATDKVGERECSDGATHLIGSLRACFHRNVVF